MATNNNISRNIGSPIMGNAGTVSSSLLMNQPSHLHPQSQSQSSDGTHFLGQFQTPIRSQAQTQVQAYAQAQTQALAQVQAQATHAQFLQAQAQAQAQTQSQGRNQNQSPGVGHVGGSSPSLSTPGTASVKRIPQKPPARPSGTTTTNTVTPFGTMELTPAARRKKRKLPEKQLPDTQIGLQHFFLNLRSTPSCLSSRPE